MGGDGDGGMAFRVLLRYTSAWLRFWGRGSCIVVRGSFGGTNSIKFITKIAHLRRVGALPGRKRRFMH